MNRRKKWYDMIWYYYGVSMLCNISFISIGCLLRMGVIVKMHSFSFLWNLQPRSKKMNVCFKMEKKVHTIYGTFKKSSKFICFLINSNGQMVVAHIRICCLFVCVDGAFYLLGRTHNSFSVVVAVVIGRMRSNDGTIHKSSQISTKKAHHQQETK